MAGRFSLVPDYDDDSDNTSEEGVGHSPSPLSSPRRTSPLLSSEGLSSKVKHADARAAYAKEEETQSMGGCSSERLYDLTASSVGSVRHRCEFEQSTEGIDNSGGEGEGEGEGDNSVSLSDEEGHGNASIGRRSTASSSSFMSGQFESAAKRRRTGDLPEVSTRLTQQGVTGEGLLAGTAASRKVLGSRYAAHALFQKSVHAPTTETAPSKLPEAASSSTPAEETTARETPGSSAQPMAAAGAVDPAVQYMAWVAASLAHYASVSGYPMHPGWYPQTQAQPAASIDTSTADRYRMEKVSRKELGVDLLGPERQDPSFAAALAAASGEHGPIELIDMHGSQIRPAFDPTSNGTSDGAAALRAAKSAAFHGSLWDGEAGEASASRGTSRMSKRKHQINYLAMDAQAKALQIQEMQARGAKARANAHQKYGW